MGLKARTAAPASKPAPAAKSSPAKKPAPVRKPAARKKPARRRATARRSPSPGAVAPSPAQEMPATPAPDVAPADDLAPAEPAADTAQAEPAAPRPAKLPRPKTVDEYVQRLDDWRGDAVARLRALVREAAPEATEAIKWAQPVFEQNGPFCYIKAFARRVNIGFWRGAELADQAGLLKGVGTRMKHIKVTGPDDIPDDAVRAFVAEAVTLNSQRGDPTRNR